MIDAERFVDELNSGLGPGIDLADEPTEAEIREAVLEFKEQGLCGRRIGQQHLGPYFLANPEYGQREIDILEDVLEEEYEGTDFCVKKRGSECSRLRGGCKYR